jgi:hypothetical protein
MTRWQTLGAILTLCVSFGSLAKGVPFTGANCELKLPPVGSGEENVHGYPAKVYPRKKDIGPEYAGCLVMWAPTTSGYEVFSITKFERGRAISQWSALDERLCTYKDDEPIGPNQDCPMYQFITPRSMPAGCVEKKMKAGGAVAGCEYE